MPQSQLFEILAAGRVGNSQGFFQEFDPFCSISFAWNEEGQFIIKLTNLRMVLAKPIANNFYGFFDTSLKIFVIFFV